MTTPCLAAMAREIHDEWIGYAPEIRHEILHPCHVGTDTCLVTRKGLAGEYPATWRALESVAARYGVRVFEDRRSRQATVSRERRNNLLLPCAGNRGNLQCPELFQHPS